MLSMKIESIAVKSMIFLRKNAVQFRNDTKEFDGCYLGHYAQWFFWFFFIIGISVLAGVISVIIARFYYR